MKRPRSHAWLLRLAKEIVEALRAPCRGTAMHLRQPQAAYRTDTGGWVVGIGQLRAGDDKYGLEIWLDCYSGHDEPKFYVGFFHEDGIAMHRLARVSKPWKIDEADLQETATLALKKKLPRRQFNVPVLESYPSWNAHFLGFYDWTLGTVAHIEARVREHAVGFYLDMARSLPHAPAAVEEDEAYPRSENRKPVKSHLARERSGYLAAQCKVRDKFRCQVCRMTFAGKYGKLGERFAEAHHIQPLGMLPDKVKTKLEDLITVCANCHRMLHRMEGKRDDIRELRGIVRTHCR